MLSSDMPGPHLGTLLVMKSSTILLLTLSVLYRVECMFEKTYEHMRKEWERYRNECIQNISSEPTTSGLFCTPMFDQYACWTYGLPNTTVKVPCPWYLPWYDQVHTGFVIRECGSDGQWLTNNISHTWRDHSQCNVNSSNDEGMEKHILVLEYFKGVYTVGYALSLTSLTVALFILLRFRKLRCTRNYIHANLFASFILRALSILIRDLLRKKYPFEMQDSSYMSHVPSDHVWKNMTTDEFFGCRVAQVISQYCVGANYFWVLVEGLYLHNLLVLLVFSENSYFCGYLVLGWVTPVIYVVPWIVLRHLKENTRCWERNDDVLNWCIIQAPILLCIVVNFSVLIRIIQILVSKLRANQMRHTDYKCRLAKSTMTLLVLLAIHKVVFSVLTLKPTEDLLRTIWLFIELFLNSLQGFLVAILYCFINKEVQSEIKKKWHTWRLGLSSLEDQRTTSSHILHGTTGQEHNDQPCQLACPEERIHLNMEPLPASTQIPLHQHHHPGAKKGKAYCYISSHKLVLNGLDTPTLGDSELDGVRGYSESYC